MKRDLGEPVLLWENQTPNIYVGKSLQLSSVTIATPLQSDMCFEIRARLSASFFFFSFSRTIRDSLYTLYPA